jgi:hypothetical protein
MLVRGRGWLVMAAVAIGWRGLLGLIAIGCWQAWRRPSGRARLESHDVDRLAALLVICLSASHNLAGAFRTAADELGGPVESAVDELLGRARIAGLSRALAETDGELSELAGQLARAQVTGAPMVPAISAFLETRRSAVRSRIMESARTLPVRLIVPVTLLLLPGFVLIAFGPFALDQVAGLMGGRVP